MKPRPKSSRPAQQPQHSPQLIQVEKPIYGGAFLARQDGKALFVPLALPGEQARVRIVEDKRGYAAAEIEEVVRAAPERIEARCPHFGACGGCSYQHAPYETQLEFKRAILRETLERGGVRPPMEISVLSGEPWAYRNRIRLGFDAAGNPGYRGRRSHAVIPIAECAIAAPLLIESALRFWRLLQRFNRGLTPTEVSLFCNADETALLISIFTADGKRDAFKDFALVLKDEIPALDGIELAIEGRGRRLNRTIARWGKSHLIYRAAGFNYRVDNGAFFQVNRWLVDELVEKVARGQSSKLAWDLFAGVGLFARRFAASFDRVVAVESAPSANEALTHNLAGVDAAAVRAETLEFLRNARGGERPDLIVVDPPRTGLGAETTALLAQVAAPAIVYVSCDPATLARDLRSLCEAGYEIDSVTLADLFPQTFHLETVVHLRRLPLGMQT